MTFQVSKSIQQNFCPVLRISYNFPENNLLQKMLKRTDVHKILIIGSCPNVIGQACEFDYSRTQACRALKQKGFEIVLGNSNPTTINDRLGNY